MPDITMPQLGETVTEGTITKWFKKVGEQVVEDEPLFEVSTDKVDSEVPSTASGYVSEILVQEGETVDIGVKLAVIEAGKPGEGGGTSQAEATEEAEGGEPAEAKAESPPYEEQTEPVPEDSDPRPPGAEAEAASAERQQERVEAEDSSTPPKETAKPAPAAEAAPPTPPST
ncbi:MAG: hypothetical protein LC733_10460 [Actinobacteria bacterium]|nr:hypothetical protein [Actinomycetota bacterium]